MSSPDEAQGPGAEESGGEALGPGDGARGAEQIFLPAAGRHVCVVARWAPPGAPAVVFCHGVGTAMSEPRYLHARLGRSCRAAGLSAVHFDYVGEGDSTGAARDLNLERAVASFEAVLRLAHERGASRLGLVGYGVGNLVAARFAGREPVRAVALLAPRFGALLEEADPWSEVHRAVARSAGGDVAVPLPRDADGPLGELWRATVGEAVVPAQPCGPVSAELLHAVRGADPIPRLRAAGKPVLVLSDDKRDRIRDPALDGSFELLDHVPDRFRSSWHWCADCRETATREVTAWMDEHTRGTVPSDRDGPLDSREGNARTRGPGVSGRGRRSAPWGEGTVSTLEIPVEEDRVLGILHRPRGPVPPGAPCVVYEPGIPGERVDIHRCGPRLGRAFAARGLPFFRYDPRGMGLSDGAFRKVTWSRRLEDLLTVTRTLSGLDGTGDGGFAILGNSAGARLAYMAANRSERVRACVAWGPILVEPEERTGKGQVRRHESGDLVTEFCGLWLGVGYNLDERGHDFPGELEDVARPGLVVFAREEENLENRRRIERIAFARPGTTVVELPGTHGFSPAAVDEAVRLTADWLARLAAGDGEPG